jgi:hypothetical protein
VPEQTLAKVYEERAEDCTRPAEGMDDPVFRRLLLLLLLMLAAQWKFAAHEEAKSKDTSSTSTQSTAVGTTLVDRREP